MNDNEVREALEKIGFRLPEWWDDTIDPVYPTCERIKMKFCLGLLAETTVKLETAGKENERLRGQTLDALFDRIAKQRVEKAMAEYHEQFKGKEADDGKTEPV